MNEIFDYGDKNFRNIYLNQINSKNQLNLPNKHQKSLKKKTSQKSSPLETSKNQHTFLKASQVPLAIILTFKIKLKTKE